MRWIGCHWVKEGTPPTSIIPPESIGNHRCFHVFHGPPRRDKPVGGGFGPLRFWLSTLDSPLSTFRVRCIVSARGYNQKLVDPFLRANPMTETGPTTHQFQNGRDDATFRHARREAILIFSVWVIALLWAVPCCYFMGFSGNIGPIDPETMPLVLGVPRWVFWGIAVPWLAADLFTVWLCFSYMEDDDLGEAHEGADLAEDLTESNSPPRAES